MTGKSLTVGQVLALLAETPGRIAVASAGVSAALLRTAPEPNSWSATEVLAHLRACADVWGNCIATIIAEERPTLRAINPRSWIKQTNYPELAFEPSLQAFTVQRVELLALLEQLPPEGWARAAMVTGAGKMLERTVHFYGQWLALHERPHLKQIERIAKALM